MGSDWTTEMCNSGMCFNGEAECRESCDRLCRQQRAQGFCYFDNFLSRVFICWCSFDQSKSSPTTTETTTTTTTAAATSSTEVSTILSVLTRTGKTMLIDISNLNGGKLRRFLHFKGSISCKIASRYTRLSTELHEINV